MKSSTLGKSISAVEVVGNSKHGVWLRVSGEEYFLSFKVFPWFREAKVASLLKVRYCTENISTGLTWMSTWK